MFQLSHISKLLLCLLFLTMAGKTVFAANEPYERTLKGRIRQNDTLVVQDEKFRNPAYKWSLIRNKSVDNSITFGINPHASLPDKPFRAKVDLKVEYWSQPGQEEPITDDHVTLEIAYDTAKLAVYQAENMYQFKNGHRIKITVNSIVSEELGTDLPDIFQLVGRVTVERQYLPDPELASQPKVKTVFLTPSRNENEGTATGQALRAVVSEDVGDELDGEMLVRWNLPKADYYDLDWVFVEKNSPLWILLATSTPSSDELQPFFRHNFTRVTVTNIQYHVSLVHQAAYIMVRVRGVNIGANGERVEEDWGLVAYEALQDTWHENTKNWQYNATYVEDGKKKEVVTYADGSLRARQTVTVANPSVNETPNTKYTVVQETLYDQFGRAAAQILPAPIFGQHILKYHPQLHLNSTGQPYNFRNFYGADLACNFAPQAMFAPAASPGKGAAGYYSASNEFQDVKNPNNRAIPQAEGFPFSVTRFTPDNTGRISEQGGVGPLFQPGGKSTRYYYGKPNQWELDRIFGNDVGYASHYMKKMVVDPNGQVSVSYENASGKVIATALAGESPANLDALQGKPAPHVVQQVILEPAQFRYDPIRHVMSGNTSYMSTTPNQALEIRYDVEQLMERFQSSNLEIYSNCFYTLKVTITNDCGDVVKVEDDIIGSKLSDCGITGMKTKTFSYTAPSIGVYYIRFELGLSEDVIGAYTDDFIRRNTSLKTQFGFILDELNRLNFKDCLADCSACANTIGEKTAFKSRIVQQLELQGVNVITFAQDIDTWSEGLYNSLSAHCTAIQNTCNDSPCEAYKRSMRDDVSPRGQYALFGPNLTPLEPELNVLSRFWKTAFPANEPDKHKEDVEIDGKVFSPFDEDFTLAMLVRYWKPEWADRFLQFHPEYCKLQWCESNATYVRWDTRLQEEITDVSRIPRLKAGLSYQATIADWLVAADPYFNVGGPGYSQQTAFRNKLLTYSQSVSMTPVKGLTQFVDYMLYCVNPAAGTNTGTDTWGNCIPEAACRIPDKEWALYKQRYLEVKEEFYKIAQGAGCGTKCLPGTTTTIGSRTCPEGAMFRLYELVPGSNNIKVNYQGNPAGLSQVKLFVEFVSDSTVVKETWTFVPGTIQTWPVPLDVEVGEIKIMRTECVTAMIAAPPCDGPSTTLVLSGSGKQENEYEFSDVDNSNPVRYFIEKGYADQTPDLNYYCTGAAAVFYNCLKVKIGTNGGEHYYSNVWLIECPPTIAPLAQHAPSEEGLQNSGTPTTAFVQSNLSNFCAGYTIYDFQVELRGDEFDRYVVSVGLPAPKRVGFPAGGMIEFHMTVNYINANNLPSSQPYSLSFTFTTGNLDQTQTAVMPWPPVPYAFIESMSLECNGMGVDTCTILSGKKSRFEDVTLATTGNDLETMTGEALAAIKLQTTQTCTDNAETWVVAMEECLRANTSTEQIYITKRAALKAGFAAVCILGGDVDHPFGSSTAMPGKQTPEGYATFGDVIKGVLGLTAYDMACNPWIINGPAPYTTRTQATKPVVSATNPQICRKLADLKALHAGNGDFHAWLVNRFGAGAVGTSEETAMLEEACGNCKFLLKKDFPLPVYLEPGTTGCIDRSTYSAAKSDFNTQISGGAVTSDPNYGLMLATFLNHRWGFTMGYDEYLAYEATSASQPDLRLCNQPAFSHTVPDDPLSCIMARVNDAVNQGNFLYAHYIREQRRLFRERYITKCAATRATVQLSAPEQIYHYTLYYYNQAGQLVRTVPPEGVQVLSDADVLAAQEARRQKPPPDCNYAGPVAEAVKSQVNASLQSLVENGGVLEYWLQQPGTAPVQAMHTTEGNTRYLINTCLNGTVLSIDIYELKAASNNAQVEVNASRHTTVDISGANPNAGPWRHVIIQGASLFSNGLTVYVNGVRCPAVVSNTGGGCGWEIGFSNGTLQYPENYTAIRHMRTYSSMRNDEDAQALAQNICLKEGNTEEDNRTAWYAFGVDNGNAPLPGGSLIESKFPAHTMRTSYAYNTLGQVVKQYSPDGKDTEFWYDYLGRLVVSQNKEQRENVEGIARRSYTKYDDLGRITEVGSISGGSAVDYSMPFLAKSAVNNMIASGNRKEVTRTYYDVAPPSLTDLTLTNLRKRVSSSSYSEDGVTEDQVSYYSYDPLGNVKSLWQQLKDLGRKQVEYNYDLASGKVNKVRYQGATANDRFLYKYTYDAENRLTQVDAGTRFTGSDPWEIDPSNSKTQAKYYYYPHGPLSRMEIGPGVQGVDYAYTLQGWLKGVNSQFLDPANDLGGDGLADRVTYLADVFGYSLSYYDNDFKPIISTFNGLNLKFAGAPDHGKQLYNGNISAMTVGLSKFTTGKHVGYTYAYDQLNRMKRMRQQLPTASAWNPRSGDEPYGEDVVYDANGNIKHYLRNGVGSGQMPLAMDDISYKYEDADGPNNLLTSITDAAADGSYTSDIKGTHGYEYDKIGNLARETWGNKSQEISWNTYGKIASIKTFEGGLINYRYDAGGNRVYKSFKVSAAANADIFHTWYVRDAQGNMLATYTKKNSEGLKWAEQALYGSSRLGLWTPGVDVTSTADLWMSANNKQYELTNHLGNVLAVINDGRTVVSQQDYYPFGSPMPGRYGLDGSGNQAVDIAGSKYRYGFNGKENDNEVKGVEGSQQDYGLRIYDLRLARFLSVDPLASKYPYYSPYHFAGNSPIKYIDMDGGEPKGNYSDWKITDGQESGVFMATDKTGAAFWVYPEAYIKQNGFLGSYVAHKYYFFDPTADPTTTGGWSKEPFLDEGKLNSLQSGLIGLSNHGDKLIWGGLAAPFLAKGGVAAVPRLSNYLWQGTQWAARVFGKEFAKETVKEFAANRGDITQMDGIDILSSTVFSKLGWVGQLGVEGLNASADFTISDGFTSVFNKGERHKSATAAGVDFMFGTMQVGTNATFKEFGGSNKTEFGSDVLFDQIKYRLNQALSPSTEKEKKTN